jgi:hypothetical protein
MANFTVPYHEAGLAAFEDLDTYFQKFLLSGDMPRLASFPMTVKANETLAQFTVVGLDAGGKLVKAVFDDEEDGSPIKAVGVLTQAVVGNAGGTTTVPVFFSGCFNPAALVWDASFDTDAKKLAAFNGSPSPTQITLRARQA